MAELRLCFLSSGPWTSAWDRTLPDFTLKKDWGQSPILGLLCYFVLMRAGAHWQRRYDIIYSDVAVYRAIVHRHYASGLRQLLEDKASS